MFKPSNLILVGGHKGFGKTDYALAHAERLVRLGGWVCYTNIYMYKPHKKGFKHITSFKKLFLEIAELSTEINIVFIIDEAGLVFTGKRSSTSGVRSIEDFTDLIRKFNILLILINPNPDKLSPELRKRYDLKVIKTKLKTARYELNPDEYGYREPLFINGVKRTGVKFDTKNPATIEPNIDVLELSKKLAPYPSEENRQHIKRIIEEMEAGKGGAVDEKVFCKELLRRLMLAGEPSPAKKIEKLDLTEWSYTYLLKLQKEVFKGMAPLDRAKVQVKGYKK